jgi:hypothetical protein
MTQTQTQYIFHIGYFNPDKLYFIMTHDKMLIYM